MNQGQPVVQKYSHTGIQFQARTVEGKIYIYKSEACNEKMMFQSVFKDVRMTLKFSEVEVWLHLACS